MKKFATILCILLFAVVSYGQKGKVVAMTADNVEGNEDIYLTSGAITGDYKTFTMTALFTKISSAAGGTAYIQGSVDGTTFTSLTATASKIYFFPNDTVTITDGGYMTIVIDDPCFKYYRFFIDGDVNDTVTITPKYILY